MKFSELNAQQWAELQPYLDTAVLPVTGLTGGEMPYEATARLERLRDVLDLIEKPFKGRIVTYPAVQYGEPSQAFIDQLSALGERLRTVGFKFVVIASAVPLQAEASAAADLIIAPEENGELPSADSANEAVRRLWLGRA